MSDSCPNRLHSRDVFPHPGSPTTSWALPSCAASARFRIDPSTARRTYRSSRATWPSTWDASTATTEASWYAYSLSFSSRSKSLYPAVCQAALTFNSSWAVRSNSSRSSAGHIVPGHRNRSQALNLPTNARTVSGLGIWVSFNQSVMVGGLTPIKAAMSF
ncbi:hypothetical protein SGRIM128S_09236 [Streptomyces griseomycini]